MIFVYEHANGRINQRQNQGILKINYVIIPTSIYFMLRRRSLVKQFLILASHNEPVRYHKIDKLKEIEKAMQYMCCLNNYKKQRRAGDVQARVREKVGYFYIVVHDIDIT